MVSSLNILVAALAATTVTANLDSLSFVESKVASAYDGEPLEVHFRSTPGVLGDYSASLAMKPVVARLGEQAIKFTPIYRVIPGYMPPYFCRKSANQVINPLPESCKDHCACHGRYCDFRSQIPQIRHDPALEHLTGRDLVLESARRTCIFNLYGADMYFRYMDAMHATGCDAFLDQDCFIQVYNSITTDETPDMFHTIKECMGPVDVTYPKGNHLLQPLMEQGMGIDPEVPSFTVAGRSPDVAFPSGGMDAAVALKVVCERFTADAKPKVCDFCLDFCHQKDKPRTDVPKCLWNLQCNDRNQTTFNDYLVSIGEDPETLGVASVHKQKSRAVETISISLVLVACAFGVAALYLTIMVTMRSYRNKTIIDQYLREQSERQRMAKANVGGVNHHLDPSFFPDENELDLDVEPALQYRDHINPAAPHQPPSRNAFLPQIN